ncbi:hypothetical protein DJ564_02970 [Pseudomonas sp. 31-12]|nr:hypothetical protein DJ564_02970 [Pseudomonas sp. 31-12]
MLLWRGSLLPLECGALPIQSSRFARQTAKPGFTTASQPNGSKLPRHRRFTCTLLCKLTHRSSPLPSRS